MCILTIEASEIKAAVKNPKAFLNDILEKHAPALLENRVRPKLENHEDYLAWDPAVPWEPEVRMAMLEIIAGEGFAAVIKSVHVNPGSLLQQLQARVTEPEPYGPAYGDELARKNRDNLSRQPVAQRTRKTDAEDDEIATTPALIDKLNTFAGSDASAAEGAVAEKDPRDLRRDGLTEENRALFLEELSALRLEFYLEKLLDPDTGSGRVCTVQDLYDMEEKELEEEMQDLEFGRSDMRRMRKAWMVR